MQIIVADPSRAVCVPSKNFLTTHQLDVDLWNEFPCTLCRENCPLVSCRHTGIFLRVPPSYAAGTFCLGPCEKHQYYGKPVIRAPTLPREREPSLPCTILSGGESRLRRRGYAIVSDRSRRCQAERRRGHRVVREGMRDQAQGDS